MSLTDTRNQYMTIARTLGKKNGSWLYEVESVNVLADNYCKAYDNGDESGKSAYFCALVCRFWYKVNDTYNENKQLGDREFFLDMLQDSILLAMSKRDWQKGKANAQTCINQTFATRGLAAAYYESNLDKHKINYNLASLDAVIGDGDGDDSDRTLGDMIEDESARISVDGTSFIVQRFIDKNKIVEAIVMDVIAYNDCEKKTDSGTEFWRYKAVQYLAKLPESYESDFCARYNINASKLASVMSVIRKANNQKLYKYLDNAMEFAKRELSPMYN